MIGVSVIVPVYNAEKYLEKCMNTICNQTLKEIEIICVNDGSTDGSLLILNQYAERDSRIQVFSQKNQYAGTARNHGMEHAQGKYLAFLDADDYYEPDMLEKMYNKAEKENSDVVICRYVRDCEDTGNTELPDWQFIDSFFGEEVPKDRFSGGQLKYAGIFQVTNGWAWDKLFRTDFVRKSGYVFPEFRSSEDGFFVYMLVTRAERISYMDEVLLTHRVNVVNSLSSTKEQDWQNGFKMLMLIKDEMDRLGIYQLYQQSFLNKVIDFAVWYLDSMHSFAACSSCYDYIQTELEPWLGILKHDRKYYFTGERYEQYKEINFLSLAEYLFRKKEGLLQDLIGHRRTIRYSAEVIDRQKKALQEKDWAFPFCQFEKGKTIVLYGAGKIGSSYYFQLTHSQFCKEVIWVDKQHEKYAGMGSEVWNPEVIFVKPADFIFLAVKNKKAQREIAEWLIGNGIPEEKIKYYGMA